MALWGDELTKCPNSVFFVMNNTMLYIGFKVMYKINVLCELMYHKRYIFYFQIFVTWYDDIVDTPSMGNISLLFLSGGSFMNIFVHYFVCVMSDQMTADMLRTWFKLLTHWSWNWMAIILMELILWSTFTLNLVYKIIKVVYLSPRMKFGRVLRNGEHLQVRVSMRPCIYPSICPGFPTIILKSNCLIHFKLGIYTC